MDNKLDKEDYHFKMKITVLGDTHSGKSTFLDSKFRPYIYDYL